MAITPKKPKGKKHPKDMTTDEAVKHLFHPKIVKALKDNAHTQNEKPTKSE